MQSTEWRAVVGYEGYYEVSGDGRVRSIDRMISSSQGATYFRSGVPLKASTNKQTGYRMVNVRGTTRSVHRLVCEAFHGSPPPGKPLACHANGIRTDNRASNIRWGSYGDNMDDCLAHGTHRNQNTGTMKCKWGHAFTPENTYLTPKEGTRQCIECRGIMARARKLGLTFAEYMNQPST